MSIRRRPPLSLYYPYIPPGIEAAVLKSMEKDPAARFRTVEEFGAALERLDAVSPAVSVGDTRKVVPVVGSEAISRPAQNVSPVLTTPPPGQTPAQGTMPAQSEPSVSRQPGTGLLAPKNLMIAGAAVLVLLVAVGVAIWKRSGSPETNKEAKSASGSLSTGGTSPPVIQPPSHSEQQTSGNQTQPTLELPSTASKSTVPPPKPSETVQQQPKPKPQPKPAPDLGAIALDKARTMYAAQRLIQPPGDCAVYWAQQATAHGSSGGPQMERQIQDQVRTQFEAALQTQNYSQASYLLTAMNRFYPGQFQSWKSELQTAELSQRKVAETPSRQVPTTPAPPPPVQASAHSFNVRHRHVNKLGFFVKASPNEATEWYSNGSLTVSSAGSVSYHCISAPNPKVCEADIVLTPSDIKNFKVNSEGMLHLSTTQGNYDFMADGNTIAAIRNELLASKQKP